MAVNNRDPGNDIVLGAHLMNMKHDPDYGLVQETIYDYATTQVQLAQVDYVGVRLAMLSKHGILGTLPIEIVEDWGTHKIHHKLIAIHDSNRITALRDFWENQYSQHKMAWIKQPALQYPGCIAWLMPTPNPAILFRPGPSNYNSCMTFVGNYVRWITDGDINPDLIDFPVIEY